QERSVAQLGTPTASLKHKSCNSTDVAVAGVPNKRMSKNFSFRGVDLDALLDMSMDKLVKHFTARARRSFLPFENSKTAISHDIYWIVLWTPMLRGFVQNGEERRYLTKHAP
ncbi:Ribosomal protein S19/S15, partial [Cynara cardunculus var. scolymus]